MDSPADNSIANPSIAARLTLSLVGAVLIVSLIAIAAIYRVVSQAEQAGLEQKADHILGYLVGSLEAPLWAVDHNEVRTIGDAVSRDESIIALTIRDDAGGVIFSVAREQSGERISRFGKIIHRRGTQESPIGDVSVSLSPAPSRTSKQRLLGFSLLIVLPILAAVVGVTVFYIRASLARPVRRLNEIVDNFASGNYGASGLAMPYREFQPFGRALAQMASRIETQIRLVHEAEAKYRSIFENAIEGIFQTSLDGRFLGANPALARGFGCSNVEELLAQAGSSAGLYVDPHDRERFLALLLECGSLSGYEVRFRRKDGEIIWVSMSARVVRDEGGSPSFIEGFLTDITDRKRAEAALLQLNRELLAISSCNQILMRAEDEATLLKDVCRVICDEAGYVMAWVGYAEDDAARTIRPVASFGVAGDFIAGARFSWAEDAESGQDPAGRAVRSGQAVCVQDIATDPLMASRREVALQRGYRSAIALPLKNENARVFGVLKIYAAVAQAITGDEIRLLEELAGDLAFGIVALRTRAERNRIESIDMARLRLLQFAATHTLHELLEETLNEAERLSGSQIGFYHFLEEDQTTLSLQAWSTRTKAEFCKAEGQGLHYPVSEAGVWADCIRERKPLIHNDYASLAWRKGLPPLHAEVVRELLVPVFRGKLIVAIIGVGNKPGDYTPQDVESVYLLADQAWEIAERKRAEEKLRQYKDQLEETVEQRTAELLLARDAAEAANKAKGLFLANMSHELRTPLNAILGFSSLMRRDPALPPGQRDNLDIINRSGEHLLTLINDVLEMAKIEAGRLQLEVAPFDLGAMVRDVAEMMQLRARDKGLHLQLDQTSAFPRFIRGDEARLRQILINLVSNAVKFTEEGGVVIRLGVKQDLPDHLLIEVEDSGPGISPEDLRRLFQPFVQLAEGGTQRGTGLGLTITRQFAQLMGGAISVDSSVGKGSVFRVELPVDLAQAADVPASGESDRGEVVGLAPGQPVYRILVAEDQRENQMLLVRLMADIGLDVRAVEDGERCVKVFEEWHPHLIWMDKAMPAMDGMEATRRIRQLPGGGEVKIVAVTASAFKEQQQAMLAAGMDEFVRKPYRIGEIYDCLAKQLGIRYIFSDGAREESPTPAAVTPAMLSSLPTALRQELQLALVSLDSGRIMAILGKVAGIDGALGRRLIRVAEDFDYPAILNALERTNQ